MNLGATGRKSLAHRTPAPRPVPVNAFNLSKTLRFPLLFCTGIIAAGFVLKLVGMNLALDFVKTRLQRQDDHNRASALRSADKWQREMAEDSLRA